MKAAYDIRMKLPNLDDKKSKVKINIMLDYLYQNLKNENHKNMTKKQISNKQFFIIKILLIYQPIM